MNVDEEDRAIAAKRAKARRYAAEPERMTLREFRVTMRSEHAERDISFSDGNWSCTCDFYAARNTCSHVMALQDMLFDNLGLRRP
ncbi:hypothetical protein [Actinomadura violacea]|uniref:SWIM-type domain-containing protein n=1 Tax=Actinomadura violacea TaxID=2819934 RepID=A0ABS3RL05_9ACTN|nr:hypothetical protein [Actinomadura violacea]MBO2457376.1 hypothetical protein [Actinomadura violacea]